MQYGSVWHLDESEGNKENVSCHDEKNINGDMITEEELVRHLSVQADTIADYIRSGRITPDCVKVVGRNRTVRYFKRQHIKKYCQMFGWQEITVDNHKKFFMEFCRKMNMSYSYKPVFLITFLSNMNDNGELPLADLAHSFAEYYEDRRSNGLSPEKRNCIFTKDKYTSEQVEKLILNMPFKRFAEMGFMQYSKETGCIVLDRNILNTLSSDDISEIARFCKDALDSYWKVDKEI